MSVFVNVCKTTLGSEEFNSFVGVGILICINHEDYLVIFLLERSDELLKV